jgi:hypothetical protein
MSEVRGQEAEDGGQMSEWGRRDEVRRSSRLKAESSKGRSNILHDNNELNEPSAFVDFELSALSFQLL